MFYIYDERMLIDTLQQYGLSEKEAKVYMAGLGLGAAPGSTIARHAGENRITVYSILKELVKRGIFISLERQGVAYFTPLSPEVLARRLEEKYTAFQEKLPELMALVDKGGNKPKVQFFEGVEGIKRAYEDTLSSEEDILAYVSRHVTDKGIVEYFDNHYRPTRIKEKIFAKVILSPSIENQEYKDQDTHNYRKSLFLKNEFFGNFECEINIYGGNKIMIALYKSQDLSSIIIESESLHHTMKTIFLHLRDSIEK